MSALAITLTLLTGGCAAQLDLAEGDSSVFLGEVDAKAATPLTGSGIEADGCIAVFRGVDNLKEVLDRITMESRDCKFGVDHNE